MVSFIILIGLGINLNMTCKVNDDYKIIRISNNEYWEVINPIEFLDILKTSPQNKHYLIEFGPDSSWFKPNFIEEINKHMGDISKASIVCSAYESNIHTEEMTSSIDIQARFLLQAFDSKKYPPTLCSYHYFK